MKATSRRVSRQGWPTRIRSSGQVGGRARGAMARCRAGGLAVLLALPCAGCSSGSASTQHVTLAAGPTAAAFDTPVHNLTGRSAQSATQITQELRDSADHASYTNLYYPGAGYIAAGFPPDFPYSAIALGIRRGGTEQANALAAEQFLGQDDHIPR